MNERRSDEEIVDVVRHRYGEIAKAPVTACGCSGTSPEATSRLLGYSTDELSALPEGANLGVGCAAPLAHAHLRAGETVLDLGSGAGMDAFLAAREVGVSGRVIGVDMTPEMLERARRNAANSVHRNVEFREGRIEALPVEDESVDVVISNCVINLVPQKAAVFREAARVLRPGGRMIISDVVLDAPLPPEIADSVAGLTGCVAGAALRRDYLATIGASGLVDVEVLEDKSFGQVAMSVMPAEMIDEAKAAGIDVVRVADTVRSLTILARKPATARRAIAAE